MKIDVLSLFPEMFSGVFNHSILKKAQEKNAVYFNVVDFREHTENKHRNVDDYPYGGGAGMVLTPQPLFDAVSSLTEGAEIKPRIILLCPQGERFTQQKAEELSREEHLIFLCGHYEGYDERIREYLVTDELSIGDYVLTGGELGAMVVIDAVSRLLPGVLGKEESHKQDSFSTGLLEHPQYTRPADFRGMRVPDVLLSGNHKNIENWRRKESLRRTYLRRPDLLEKLKLTKEEEKWLEEIKISIQNKTT
jgi:tRNA (guanine37-N1)-methyltransferase